MLWTNVLCSMAHISALDLMFLSWMDETSTIALGGAQICLKPLGDAFERLGCGGRVFIEVLCSFEFDDGRGGEMIVGVGSFCRSSGLHCFVVWLSGCLVV